MRLFTSRDERHIGACPLRHNLPDEGDNHIVELAVAGGSEVIVTNNVRDFRRAQLRFPGLRTVSPHEFLKELA